MHVPNSETEAPQKLLRIHEVAAELGLTARSIRYYEEIGLLEPVGRSDGDYRLYDSDDLDRLGYIKGLRDDAGFSLAEIAQLLEDETARTRNRARFRETHDPAERTAILQDALARIARQVDTLRAKADRLEAMIGDANQRRVHVTEHLAEIEAEVAGDAEAAAAPHAQAAAPHAQAAAPHAEAAAAPHAEAAAAPHAQAAHATATAAHATATAVTAAAAAPAATGDQTTSR